MWIEYPIERSWEFDYKLFIFYVPVLLIVTKMQLLYVHCMLYISNYCNFDVCLEL